VPRDNGSPEWIFTELFVALLADVTRLLADVDPVGLTRAGAPTDEYDVEAGQIVRRVIREGPDPDGAQHIVVEVFEDYFGERYENALAGVGDRVLRLYQSLQQD
jgi:hypothetical protein